MRKYLLISSYIRKPFLIQYITLQVQLLHSEFTYTVYEEISIFFFISVGLVQTSCLIWG
jgi:hypothetical protein